MTLLPTGVLTQAWCRVRAELAHAASEHRGYDRARWDALTEPELAALAASVVVELAARIGAAARRGDQA